MICKAKAFRNPAIFLVGLAALGGCSEAEPAVAPMDRAQAALERGDGFGAELALREAVDAGAQREAVAAFFGQAELQQGQLTEARQWLTEGRFSAATAGHGFHMLGRLHMSEGNLAAAGAAFDRAIAIEPDNPRLWVDIGRLRYRGGEQSAAVEAAMRAIELGPEDPDALLFRGQLARDSEGAIAALPWFERAQAAKPTDSALQAEYAATLGEAGEAKELLRIVRQMTAADPGAGRAYFLQAVIAARGGHFALARTLLNRSGRENSGSPAGRLLAGVIDLETGNPASAAQTFDRLHRQQPENRRVRDLLARALAVSGSHRELVHRFAQAARRQSASPYLQTLVARSYEALGRRAEAGLLIDLAARRRSGNLAALRPTGAFADGAADQLSGPETLALVRARITGGRSAEAKRQAEAFVARFPGSADALALAGDAQLAGGNLDKAIAYYERSARIRQSWPLARKRLAALTAAGRDDEARALLGEFLAGHQALVEPAVLLAQVQYNRGNFARAARLLDHALATGGGSDPEVLALRAVVAMRLGEPQLARSLADRAFALQPIHPASLQALALSGSRSLSSVVLAKADRLDKSPRRLALR